MFNGGDLNLYGYVSNDPINYFDPTGLASLCEALRELWENDRTWLDGLIFIPTNLATEYISEGGHGPSNAHFTHSDGKSYDIQYIQVAWQASRSPSRYIRGNKIPAIIMWNSWQSLNWALGNDEYFLPENYDPNHNGMIMGWEAAEKFYDFDKFIDSICDDDCEK